MTLRALADPKGISIGVAMNTWGSKPPAYYNIAGTEFSHINSFTHFGIQNPEKGIYNWQHSDLQLAFAQDHGQSLYAAGLLFWWSDPEWVKPITDSNELTEIMTEYISIFLHRYKGNIRWATVVNENLGLSPSDPRNATIPWRRIGTDPLEYVRIAFRAAHAVDWKVRLLYNDNGFEFNNLKTQRILAAMTQLKSEKVPIHGIGFQCHLNVDIAPNLAVLIPKFVATIKKFKAIGLQPYITELDVAIPKIPNIPPTLTQLLNQKKIYNAMVRAALANGCKMVTCWTLTDAMSWLDSAHPNLGYAGLWDSAYQKKPCYFGVASAITGN